MNKLIKITLVFLFFQGSLFGQNTFPSKWLGEYSGTMKISSLKGKPQQLKVNFEIKEIIKDSLWSHKMVFTAPDESVVTKDYRIKRLSKDNAKDYVLDEQNGLEIELSYLDDCFYSMYTVMGTTYVSTLRRINSDLLWDLFGVPKASKKTTTLQEDHPQPELIVDSYKTSLHQTALLKLKN
ncbi:MAG: hypothetical protein ACPGRE_04615 [Flavobacteriaceae bacterium]